MKKRNIIIGILLILSIVLVLFAVVQIGEAAWFDPDFAYCRKFTMTAGGESGGVATTTTAGFTLAATSTISDWIATSTGGKVEKLDANNNLPLDIIFTDGTDCKSDGGSLIPFYFERSASTTGEFAVWVNHPDVSSTTAKTMLAYYGNPSATDQSNEIGTWPSEAKAIINMNEDPTIATDGSCGGGTKEICDSTSNSNDGDTAGFTASSESVTGMIGNALQFDATNNEVTLADHSSMDLLDDFTIMVWVLNEGSPGDVFPRIVHKADGPGPANGSWVVRENDGTGVAQLKLSDGAANTFVSSSGTITDNEWTFIAIVFDDSADEATWYVNTVADTDGGITTATLDNNEDVRIGLQTGPAQEWDGPLDMIRLYDTELHSMDVRTVYNNTSASDTFWTIGGEEPFSVPERQIAISAGSQVNISADSQISL